LEKRINLLVYACGALFMILQRGEATTAAARNTPYGTHNKRYFSTAVAASLEDLGTSEVAPQPRVFQGDGFTEAWVTQELNILNAAITNCDVWACDSRTSRKNYS
jgi:hypothetical protein